MEPPQAARDLFGARLPLAERYVNHLSSTGVEWGLIGPREVPRLWNRHVLNCAVVAELVPSGASVVDVGSGAGLPGLPLALGRPDLEVTLVEPLERRCRWLIPLLNPGGSVLALKGRTAAEEVEWATKALRKLKVREVEILGCGQELLDEPTTVVRLRR